MNAGMGQTSGGMGLRKCSFLFSVSKVAKMNLYSVLSSSVFLEFISESFFPPCSFYEFVIKIIPESLRKTSFKLVSLKE